VPFKIRSGNKALLLSPNQNQVVIDDIIFRMFWSDLHTFDYVSQPRIHVRHGKRAMPIDLQIKRLICCVRQSMATLPVLYPVHPYP
jgi:hypothetical protein